MKGFALKVLAIASAAGVAAGALAIFAAPTPAGLFALDVGQGDSILVRAPNGADALIDVGPPGGAASRAFSRAAPRDRELSALLLTHQDLDHSGGAKDFLGRFQVGNILAPVWGGKASEILETALARGVATGTLQRGDRIWLDRETPVYVDVLWPPAGGLAGNGNDGSLVARLTYGATSAILTGDAPKGVEKILAAAGDPIDADILKVGHHGSKTSTDLRFVAAVSPALAIVSAGRGNRYGHPAPEVVATLRASGATVISTADQGTASLLWDGRVLVSGT